MLPQDEISQLQRSLETLLAKYADLQSQVSVLQTTVNAQHEEIIRSHAELAQLRAEYKRLQTAHALTAPSEERDKAKRQLTSIISKIDQTLELIKD